MNGPIGRPLLVVVTSNLMDIARFESAATDAGYRMEAVDSAGTSAVDPLVAFVDLEVLGADDAVADLAVRGVKVIAYGPHIDTFAISRARTLGAVVAEPRSRILRNPGAHLPPLV